MTTEMSARDRSIASLIFGFLLACYLLTYTGFIQSSDGLAMFATVESMVRRGQVDSNQLLWMDIQQGSFGPDGELYSRKGLGMPLLAFPLVWLANTWPALGLAQAALLLNPLLTAWTGALVFRAGRRLEWGRTASMFTALAFGLATFAWPYTQTFFSDPVAAWGLFGAFYGILAYRQTNRKRYLALAGIAWGIAYLSRVINIVTLPIYLVLLVIVIMRSLGRSLQPDILRNLRSLIIHNWRAFSNFLLPVMAAGLASLWWNWVRYGNIFDSGYVEAESFSADWLFGISGLLVGPSRGLIWYAPILLLAVFGAPWFWREKRWILLTVFAISLTFVGLYGKWFMWHGGFSWGPRFMVVLLPFLGLLTGPVFEKLSTNSSSSGSSNNGSSSNGSSTTIGQTLGRLSIAILFVVSVAVQWLGMLAPFQLLQDWLAQQVQPLFAPETFTSLGYSPLLLQWRFISQESMPLGWWQSGSGIDWLALVISLAGIVVGSILIVRQVRSNSLSDAQPSNLHSSAEQSGPRYWIYTLALIFMALALLTHYRTSQANPVLDVAIDAIQTNNRSGDAILHLRPTLTQEFANQYHGELPVYGLFARDTLTARDQEWLAHLRQNYRRLWILATPGLPESSGWERQLRADDYLLENGTLDLSSLSNGNSPAETNSEEVAEQRLPLYGLSQPSEMVEHGLGAIFGRTEEGQELTTDNAEIRLNGYAALPSVNAGAELLLTLRWESLEKVDQNYHVFVHILNEQDEMVAQRDGQPVQWMRPISTWQPGDVIVDRYGLILPADVALGRYRINVGLYDPNDGSRLPVNTDVIQSAVELEPFEVVAAP